MIWTKATNLLPCDWVNDHVNRLFEILQRANGEYTQYSDAQCKQQSSSLFVINLNLFLGITECFANSSRLEQDVFC